MAPHITLYRVKCYEVTVPCVIQYQVGYGTVH